MTNLRDALEKAGITPDSPTANSRQEPTADQIVDDISHFVEPDNGSDNLEADRPKLVDDANELSSVVDRIGEIMSADDGNDFGEAGEAIDESGDTEFAAEAEKVAAEMQFAADMPNNTPSRNETPTESGIDLSPVPLLNTERLSKAKPPEASAGGFSEDIQSIDDLAPRPLDDDNVPESAQGVEVPAFDPLGIENDMAIDPNQPATYDEYEEFELVPHHEDHDDSATGDFGETERPTGMDGTSADFESQDNFDDFAPPQNAEEMAPGQAVSVTTTDEAEIGDPVATANEITNGYEPQDLDAGFPDLEYGDSISDETSDVTSSIGKAMLAAAASAAAAQAPFIRQPEDGPSEPKSESFLETTNLRDPIDTPTTKFRPTSKIDSLEEDLSALKSTPVPQFEELNEPEKDQVAAKTVTSFEVGNVDTVEMSTVTLATPALVSATTTDEVTAFEKRLLENLTASQDAKEYEELSASILETSNGRPPKTVCFVSAESAVHATEVVSNLAAFFATKMSKRVLMVDASACTDGLTRAFRKDKLPGLKNMTTVDDGWADMVLNTVIPKLSLLPVGWRRGVAAEWSLGQYAELMSHFAREYDITLVDGGIAERTEDTPFFAAADRTLLLVRLGQTNRNVAAAVRDGLMKANVKLDACVVTNQPVVGSPIEA